LPVDTFSDSDNESESEWHTKKKCDKWTDSEGRDGSASTSNTGATTSVIVDKRPT
jgi:hypothetical protein